MARSPRRTEPPSGEGGKVVPLRRAVGGKRTVSGIERAVDSSAASASAALDKALRAASPEARARSARAGLAKQADPETQALLLRQLYLGELECGRYEEAYEAARQAVSLRGGSDPMIDVAHHDAARACQAMEEWDDAVAHLEEAIAKGPAERKLLHLSTLGGLLYAIGRGHEAVAPLERALENAGTLEPLLRAQLVLARRATRKDASPTDPELDLAFHELSQDSSGEGYGRFVLGELAAAKDDRVRARLHLEAFLAKVRKSRPAAQAALAAEVARATQTLGTSVWN